MIYGDCIKCGKRTQVPGSCCGDGVVFTYTSEISGEIRKYTRIVHEEDFCDCTDCVGTDNCMKSCGDCMGCKDAAEERREMEHEFKRAQGID